MIRFMSLSSGSCGNSYYLAWQPDAQGDEPFSQDRPAGILIDAGVSLRRLKRELGNAGADFSGVSAILVTHDHMDHVRFLGSYCKRLAFPVYATPVLHRALQNHPFTSAYIPSCRRELVEGSGTGFPLPAVPFLPW